jgi:hypothetical protein
VNRDVHAMATAAARDAITVYFKKLDDIMAKLFDAEVRDKFDVLFFWKEASETWCLPSVATWGPTLVETARCVLGAAVASSNVERLFSVAGFMKNKLRNRMSPANLDHILTVRAAGLTRRARQ